MAALTELMKDKESIRETIEILSDPEQLEALKTALKQVEKGETLTEEELFRCMP